MTTPTPFDTEFRRLTTEMVEIAFEYIGFNKEETDGIYLYASMENGIYFFNLFYNINRQLIKKDFVNNILSRKVDDSDETVDTLLSTGNHLLLELADLFESDKREVPALLKMVYLPKTGGFDCEIIYESQYSHHKTMTNVDVFNNWLKEIQTQ